MSSASLRSLVATSLTVALTLAGLALLIGPGGSATASSSTVSMSASKPTAGTCLAQAKELTDSTAAVRDASAKFKKTKKALKRANQAEKAAKISDAKKRVRRAKQDLRLQVEWYTTSKDAYDRCMKANSTGTPTVTSTPSSTATPPGTAIPTGVPTTLPTTLPTLLPTPACIPLPFPPGRLCL